jgi:Ring finger domain
MYAVSGTPLSSPIIQHALDDGGSFNRLAVHLLMSLTIVFAAVGIGLARILRRRRRWGRRESSSTTAASSSAGLRLTAEESSKQKEVARYNNIENWIVSKRIHLHDDLCAKCIGLPVTNFVDSENKDPDTVNRKRCNTEPLFDLEEDGDEESSLSSSSMSNKSSSNASSSDEHHHGRGGECSICFEKLLVHEIASWSPNPECHHVFHHACIKEWLLHNAGCPTCRATFLPVDMRPQHKKSGFKHIAELVHAQQQRSRHCYYCVRHGVVYLPCNRILKSRLPCSDELDSILKRGQQVPTKEELFETRGGGQRKQGNYEDDELIDDQDLESPACCGTATTITCSMTTLNLDSPAATTTAAAAAAARDDDDDGQARMTESHCPKATYRLQSDGEWPASPTLVDRSFSI